MNCILKRKNNHAIWRPDRCRSSIFSWARRDRALLGPNDAGKTTLFNIISGINIPTGGRVILNGRDIIISSTPNCGPWRWPDLQNILLFDDLTSVENVMVGRHQRANP